MIGQKDLIKKIGVDRRVYTAGKNKSTLDPFLEEKKEDIERLKNIQLDLHKDFIKVVEDSRGSKLNKNSGIELFSGEFWSGSKSKELGLVDGIGNVNEILRKKFGEDVVINKFVRQNFKITLSHLILTLYMLPLISWYVSLLVTEMHLLTELPNSWIKSLQIKYNRLLMDVIETLPRI